MAKALIKIEGLQPASFCDEISFQAAQGEILCLFGLNGSGKTLLVKAICGLFAPFAGNVEICVSKKDVGVSLQFPEHLVFCDTALKEATIIMGNEEGAKKLLNEIRVDEGASPFFMSDGQKRLLFVYGLLETKTLLIFDEPFASLDSDTKSDVALRMKQAAKSGKTIIYTANRDADTKVADKIINICGRSSLIPLKI